MKINLAKLTESREKVITSDSDIFEGTDLHNQGFSVTIKRLGRTEQIDMIQELGEDATAGKQSKAIFINSIVGVEGFEDENGTPMGLEHGVRELIWDYFPELTTILEKEITALTKGEEEKKSDSEIDSEPTLIG